MAHESPGFKISLNAPSTAFSAKQYYMVLASTAADKFAAGSSAVNKTPIGVLQDAPTVSGEPCTIVTFGITKAVVGSTKLQPGSRVVSGANGVALSTATVGSQQQLCGIWLTAGASTGTIGSMYFNPMGTWST